MTLLLFRAVLALAPRDFLERYGADALEAHRARAVEGRGWSARIRFAVTEVVGLAWTVIRLHGEAVMDRGHAGRGRGGASMFETLGQDLRFAARTLKRSPGFTAAAVGVLALGIGASTAIFSAANAFLFRPLPFADADRLVMLYETNPEFGWTRASAAPANVFDWREQVEPFQDVATYSDFIANATYFRDGEPGLLQAVSVSGNFFTVLGVAPVLGRGFREEETWAPDDDVAVLSHAFWISEFGGDPGVVGRSLELGTTTLEIVGVMPEGFAFPNPDLDVWTPWGWDAEARQAAWFRRAHWVFPVARLRPGATVEEADAALQVVVGRLQETYPETNRVMGAGMEPLRDFLVADVRTPLAVLMGAVLLLLLLACTNVANLMLVRAAGRTREVALRFSLGAGRLRVARLLLTEGIMVALLGGAAGLALGWWGIQMLALQQPVGIRGATALALDGRVVLFTLAASLLSGILFGLAPVLTAARGAVHAALKDGARGTSGARRRWSAANGLVAAEVALAVLLVVGAGLMVRTFGYLRGVDPGFRSEGVLGVQFTIPSTRYPERDAVLAFQDDFQRRLRARPGVEAVGLVGRLPLAGANWSSQFQAEGWPPERVGFEILHRRADPGYFQALGIPLVRGRLFTPDEGPDTPLTVVVNETFAREHFPGEDPIGQRIAYDRAPTAESSWYEIVGIVGDQLQVSPALPARAEVFESRKQDWTRGDWTVVRTTLETAAATAVVEEVLREMDPLIPIAAVRPLPEVWRASMADQRFVLTLLVSFGAMALLLASVGVFGVTAQVARRRTQEIGIRMALGADGGSVVTLMVRQMMAVVAVGLVVGLAGALWATRAMASLLHGVTPHDPLTLGVVSGGLALVAAVACWLPARRASGVDPVASLRAE